jgi:hypothetical protein
MGDFTRIGPSVVLLVTMIGMIIFALTDAAKVGQICANFTWFFLQSRVRTLLVVHDTRFMPCIVLGCRRISMQPLCTAPPDPTILTLSDASEILQGPDTC